ncbi:MAG: hypothetical protein PHI19_03665, partial [Clostridia bacterium]|nr:hypothetical protein [Clostridia bacterium]
LIADWTKYLLFLSPYHTAFLLANSTVAQASVSDILVSIAYLTIITAGLLSLVGKKYSAYVIRG